MTDDELVNFIADDDLNLLKIAPKRTPQSTEEEMLLKNFQELVMFVEETGSAPYNQSSDLKEKRLHARLEAIRSDPQKKEKLKAFDEYGILESPEEEPKIEEAAPPESIDDILNDSFLDEIKTDDLGIFDLKHVPKQSEIDSPDYVGRRKRCEDFELFEEPLKQCQAEIKEGKRKLLPFTDEQHIEAGKFYILKGVLMLVAEVGEKQRMHGRINARLRCIYENGTEGDPLLRSLSSLLYRDGRRVSEPDEALLKSMIVDEDDNESGFIYVLRSLSEDPEIKALPNLYKVGLARKSIETRIQNAKEEPTYLRAPVAVVSTFQCYNVNLPKLENLIHRFFAQAAVQIQVQDPAGNYFTPKEWFSVPLEEIQTAIRLLISGDILDFEYDAEKQRIVRSKK